MIIQFRQSASFVDDCTEERTLIKVGGRFLKLAMASEAKQPAKLPTNHCHNLTPHLTRS